jgi:sulfur-oxidizing protein SoxY
MRSCSSLVKHCAIVIAAGAACLALSGSAGAADAQNDKAFEAKDIPNAFIALGVINPGPGKRILLDVPEIVDEKGNLVIKVKTAIPESDWIAVFIDKNPYPLVGTYDLANKADAIEVKAKLAQTSTVTAVVRANGKYYRVDKEVKVAALGGCE